MFKEAAALSSQKRARTVQGKPTFVQMQLLLPYTLGFSFLLRGKPWRSVMAEDRSAISIVRESKILAYTVGVATLAAGLVLLFWPDRTFTVVAHPLAGRWHGPTRGPG